MLSDFHVYDFERLRMKGKKEEENTWFSTFLVLG